MSRGYVVLLIATLKGGVRKSTSAMMLAFAYARKGFEVLVIDADSGTQGVADWSSKVYASGGELPFHVVQWTQSLGLLVPFVQAQQRETEATIIIIDVGGEAPEVLRQAAVLADLAVSPTGAEQGELGRIPATAAVLADTKTPMHVLLTRVPSPGLGVAAKAREALVEDGFKVLGTETPQDRETYAHVWGTVPKQLGVYDKLADELDLGAATK
jgi:chromosome partitioning protein